VKDTERIASRFDANKCRIRGKRVSSNNALLINIDLFHRLSNSGVIRHWYD